MRSSSYCGVLAVAIVAALIASGPASAQDAGAPGATVESVLALGRRLSPELRAVALDTEAAAARADAAGRLDDPTFRAMSDEVDRTSGPRINKTYLSIEQEFSLWGKLELRRSAALAAVDAARGRERAAEAELDEKIKAAFARYYAASQALAINRELSLSAMATIMAGFFVVSTPVAGFMARGADVEMLRPYVARFADALPDVWQRRTIEEAETFTELLFPRHFVDEQAVARIDQLLADDRLPHIALRILREGRDGMLRARRAQEADQAAAED